MDPYFQVLIQKVMEFIDRNGDEVLSLPSFSILPKHVVQLIISRESLAVSEVCSLVLTPSENNLKSP